jgi:hypothetical protein
MQQANTMAYIVKSVKEGQTTRAEADAILKKIGYKERNRDRKSIMMA